MRTTQVVLAIVLGFSLLLLQCLLGCMTEGLVTPATITIPPTRSLLQKSPTCTPTSWCHGRSLQFLFARRTYYDSQDDDWYDEDDDSSDPKRRTAAAQKVTPYWEDDDDGDSGSNFANEEDPDLYTAASALLEKDVLEWEKCASPAGTAWVLLPPISVECPTAILHFVGGTFTGSAPNIWYRRLLQDIVRHTSAAVIATSIPVTLNRSPLDHVRLAKTLQQQFLYAYRTILQDEYDPNDVARVQICGLGHSLGSRLLVVLATLSPKIPYKSYVLMSFINFGAAAGIPGISQLYKRSRYIEQNDKMDEEKKRPRKADWNDSDDDYDDYDGEYLEDDWGDLFRELSATFQAGTARVQSALTPPSSSLEFIPSPEQLWGAINEGGRYKIPQTLVVQFDDDEVDQSSRLAAAVMNCTDIKFARLRGTHLTPVSTDDSNSKAWLEQINNRASRILLMALQGRRRSRPENAESLLELRQSIARYITEVVTKD
jgi:Protein of unknown function (DUF1350)